MKCDEMKKPLMTFGDKFDLLNISKGLLLSACLTRFSVHLLSEHVMHLKAI